MSKLTIYKASAGSGKTHTLTGEFLKILFCNPSKYKNILAVTFTNKATDEMKSRILKEIHLISLGKSSPYENELCELSKLNKEKLRTRAEKILNHLLHDYSRFSVTTIDSFFQKILRSFMREISLQSGYHIELDQTKVLNNATDLLIQDIDHDKQLRKWLSSFAESKIVNGKAWNFKRDILALGNEVFKEEFQGFSKNLTQKLADKKFLNAYRKELLEIKIEFEDFFAKKAKETHKVLVQHSLKLSDFAYGERGVAGYLSGLARVGKSEPGLRAKAALNQPQKWTVAKTRKSKQIEFETTAYVELNEILRTAIQYYDTHSVAYHSVEKTLANIYMLGIFTDLSKKIREYATSENIFMLANTNQLLRDVIGDNETPFIYEKLGNLYQHFMIDEFQDTSSMQWENFKPLLQNALAEGNNSLVVGDVKQSIYRWRNGNWKLLAHQLKKDFKGFEVSDLVLKYNWRSSKNLIDFNNSVFVLGSQILQNSYNESLFEDSFSLAETQKESIVDAYNDVYQNLPRKKSDNLGYVSMKFVKNETNWHEAVLHEIPEKIEKLQTKGYLAKDIAILVRNAKEGKWVADALMTYKDSENAKKNVNYKIISNDSLYLKSSPAIQFLVHLLELFAYPDNPINIAFLKQEYALYLGKHSEKISDELYSTHFNTTFPTEFQNRYHELKRQSVYDLIEQLIQIFKLYEKMENVSFLLAFQDLALHFSRKNFSDVSSFLQFWEEEKDKSLISVSEKQDAIRIMTIHKSKGLEFKAVILPFVNWNLDHSNHANILWCQPKSEKFKHLDLLPIPYGSSLKNTIYKHEYFEEKLQAYIDNLNLLYVAQTRAKQVLIGYAPLSENKDLRSVSDLLQSIFRSSQKHENIFHNHQLISLHDYWNEEEKYFELGEIPMLTNKELEGHQAGENMVYPKSQMNEKRLMLKLHSENDFDLLEQKFSPLNRGNILHQLFCAIEYAEDLDEAVFSLKFKGILNNKQADEMYKLAKKILLDPHCKNWFTKNWKVINERNILTGKAQTYRPDRVLIKEKKAVVIDYKFGKKKLKTHEKQIETYKELVKKLGFEEVKAFLLYGNFPEITEV